jgi:DNA ligase 1
VIDVRYDRGVYLPHENLWLDPRSRKPFAFVSHAHSDHLAPHDEIIVSERTARLMRARLPGKRNEHVVAFGDQRTIRGLDLMLLPAGHIVGSAQFFLQTDNGSLLYTGDFKLRRGRSAEQMEWRHAETLIMETTYGLPRYQLPPTDEVIEQIVAFCLDTLEAGAVPVLLGYSLGKAQEILCSVAGAGLRPMLHGSVHAMTRICEQCGQSFCEYERYKADDVAGKVLICPPSANRSPMLERIRDKRVALISGWAVDPNAVYRYQVDAAFPLSDHADYADLLRYVELVQPQRVLTLHGFAAEFACDLRHRGIEAWALSEENQMELALKSGERTRPRVPFAAPPPQSGEEVREGEGAFASTRGACAPQSEFHAFATIGEAIAATPAKLEKIRLLAEYFRTLTPSQLGIASIYFTGKPFPQGDLRTLQVGWAVIRRALTGATGLSEAEFRRIASSHGDAGKTALEVLEGRTFPEPFTLGQSREFFESLHQARSPVTKAELLQARFRRISPREGQYLVKILTGDLRIGLREGLVEESIASSFDVPLDDVKEANMLLGDIGETARLALTGELQRAEITLFRPIKCMLASPEPTAEAIWARFAPESSGDPTPAPPPTVYVEDKFDGIRAQLHRGMERVEIFSRDLRRMTDQFSELAEEGRKFEDELILDGEIMAFEQGKKLTFFDLQKRLGRKNEGADLFASASADVPVVFVAFDLIWKNGQSFLRKPLRERRYFLRSLKLPPQFQIAETYPAHSAQEIEGAFQLSRRRLNEGLMVKDPESSYSPGRRGMLWFKLKKELATLDVVVVAAELGHGKRNHVLSDYTFAVRDESTGLLSTIGKAYSGLTDAEIAELTEHFKKQTVANHGRYREVKPDIVLEIAFDSIQPSTRHPSGLALRFPRIKAIRRDKGADAIDTLAYARTLATRSGSDSNRRR